jgi:hypothetical protein
MIKIKLSTPSPDFPLIRQTPDSNGIWADFVFYIDQEIEDCDYWVVLDSLNTTEKVKCKRENTILITGEPGTVKKYSNIYIRQFNRIITCHRNLKHNNVTYIQQGLPWMAGARYLKNEKRWDNDNFISYNDFLTLNNSKKKKEISIILSNKTYTTGHERRVIFLNRLKEEFGNDIEIFGRGFNEIEDKFDGIADFKYTIVLENSSINDYWTEKISDAFLCGAFPIYYGCSNIYDYFPKGSLATIDINNVEASIRIIRSVIESNQYEKSLDLIKESKELVLNRYNLFPLIVDFINNLDNTKTVTRKKKTIRIFPERRIRKKLRKIANRIFDYKFKQIIF